jgi:transcriptional regulator with GAF, ATPase, and Fis domain
MLKRWIEHHYLKQQFQRLERERQEIEQLREDTKHVLSNQLACRIADALLSYGVRNLPDDAEMNDICAMLLDYGQSRRGYLTQCLSIDKKYDDALNNDMEAFNKEAEAIYQNMKQELNAEQRRKTLIERFKNRRDAKKAGE